MQQQLQLDTKVKKSACSTCVSTYSRHCLVFRRALHRLALNKKHHIHTCQATTTHTLAHTHACKHREVSSCVAGLMLKWALWHVIIITSHMSICTSSHNVIRACGTHGWPHVNEISFAWYHANKPHGSMTMMPWCHTSLRHVGLIPCLHAHPAMISCKHGIMLPCAHAGDVMQACDMHAWHHAFMITTTWYHVSMTHPDMFLKHVSMVACWKGSLRHEKQICDVCLAITVRLVGGGVEVLNVVVTK